jgi:hypothetical protein
MKEGRRTHKKGEERLKKKNKCSQRTIKAQENY